MKTLEQLLGEQWVKRDGSPDERMVKYCMKSSLYVQSGANFINCGEAKPPISTTLWYDDTTKRPEVTFEYFKSRNMRSNAPSTFEERSDRGRIPYISKNYTGDRAPELVSVVFRNELYDRFTGDERPATDAEVALIKEALVKARADYEKRLATYWKRYSKNVHANGYWVNR